MLLLLLYVDHVDAGKEVEGIIKVNPYAKICYKGGKRDNNFLGIRTVFYFWSLVLGVHWLPYLLNQWQLLLQS